MASLEYATADAVRSRIELNEDEQTDWSEDETDFLQKCCDAANDYVEDRLEFPAGPSDATYLLLDGNGRDELFVRIGIREITGLEIAPYTGAAFETVPVADVVLRPLEHDRSPGKPAQRLKFSDQRTGSYGTFPVGYANIKPTGSFGPEAMLPRVVEIAETAAARAWLARRAGQRDMTGNDEQGQPLISRYVSGRDMRTLERLKNAYRRFTV